jgi:hypothetical protein
MIEPVAVANTLLTARCSGEGSNVRLFYFGGGEKGGDYDILEQWNVGCLRLI